MERWWGSRPDAMSRVATTAPIVTIQVTTGHSLALRGLQSTLQSPRNHRENGRFTTRGLLVTLKIQGQSEYPKRVAWWLSPSALHPAPYTLHPAPCTLLPPPCTCGSAFRRNTTHTYEWEHSAPTSTFEVASGLEPHCRSEIHHRLRALLEPSSSPHGMSLTPGG